MRRCLRKATIFREQLLDNSPLRMDNASMPSYSYQHCVHKMAWLGLMLTLGAATVACGQTTLSTNSIADAFVTPGANGSLASSNFGAAGALAVAAPNLPQGEFQTVIKFQLSGITSELNSIYGTGLWSVQSVSLQLTASSHGNSIFNPVAAGNFNISLMQNNSWVEGTGTGGIPANNGITYDTLQSTYINDATDQALGTFSFGGGTTGIADYSLNLSSSLISDLLDGNDVSLRLYAADNQISYLFTSRESGGLTTSPTLVISVVPEPGTLALCTLALAAFSLWRLEKKNSVEQKTLPARRTIK